MRKKKTVYLLSLFSIILVLALATSPIKAETEILTKKFYPTDDTYISEQQNTTSFGDEPLLKIRDKYGFANTSGWGWDALTKFNISTIPENSSILSATLNLYLTKTIFFNETHNKLSLYRITNHWDENNTTWVQQPNYQSNPLLNQTITNNPDTWITYNLTNEIKKINNKTIYHNGWMITNTNHWGHFDIPEFIFTSKENQTKPYLEIKIKNQNPQPKFNYTYNISNRKVNFTENSTDSDGSIVSYLWEFGDGTTSTQKNTTHTYRDYGEYQVNLTVEDDQGIKTKLSKTIILNIEEKIKKEIEETFNITLAENFYAYNLNEINDPNQILTIEQIINFPETTFLISINNSKEKLFLWNTNEDFITLIKYREAELIQNIKIENKTYRIDFSITQNQSFKNYIQIKDFCPNITNLTIKRSDNTTVPQYNIFRQNQKIYFLDKNYSKYSLIYTNSTLEQTNETKKENNITKNTSTLNSNLNLTLTLIIIIGLTIMPITIYSINRRKNYNIYLQNGHKKIKEIDNFLKEK